MHVKNLFLSQMRATLLKAMVCCALLSPVSSRAQDAATDHGRQFIALFVAEQQKSLVKLSKYEVELEVSIQFESQGAILQHTATLYQKHSLDELFADVKRRTIERSSSGRVMEQDTSAKLLVGNTYAVYWLTRSPRAEMWEYEFGGALPRPVALLRSIDMDGEYLHKFGYGTLDFKLAQLLEPKYADRYRYEVSTRDDQKYNVCLFFKEGTGATVGHPVLTFIVDPSQGHLIVESVMFDPDGKPFRVIHVKGQEIVPGIWFPMGVEVREYDASATMIASEPGVISLKHYTVKSVNTKPAFSADTFTWKALEFPVDLLVYRRDRLNALQEMVIANGELVPKELATGPGSSRVR